MIQYKKAVKDFLNRTNSGHKVYFFHFQDKFIENEWGCSENIGGDSCDFLVGEVASEFTLNGGKLHKIDVKQLAEKFAKMRGWKIRDFAVVDRAIASNLPYSCDR